MSTVRPVPLGGACCSVMLVGCTLRGATGGSLHPTKAAADASARNANLDFMKVGLVEGEVLTELGAPRAMQLVLQSAHWPAVSLPNEGILASSSVGVASNCSRTWVASIT